MKSFPQQFIRPILLQEPAGDRVRCFTCERRCEIAPGKLGWCKTRLNQDGRLVTMIYGAISSLSANPIEKKPFYHFYPGTTALTSGAWSCNFACPWCQNDSLSKTPPGEGRYMSPEEFVATALSLGCQGTSISFNEPTLSLEWALDVFRRARQQGLYNTFVSNGYMTPEALRLLVEAGLNAINIDIKGDVEAVKQYCGGIKVEKIWRNCRRVLEQDIHLEIVTLVIPGVNDRDETLRDIARRIVTDLGTIIPWHVNGYYPAYRFNAPPTPFEMLEHAWQIGKEAGLKYVYVGNVPGHSLQNTICPDCGTLLIERLGFYKANVGLIHGNCPHCGRNVPGVWG